MVVAGKVSNRLEKRHKAGGCYCTGEDSTDGSPRLREKVVWETVRKESINLVAGQR